MRNWKTFFYLISLQLQYFNQIDVFFYLRFEIVLFQLELVNFVLHKQIGLFEPIDFALKSANIEWKKKFRFIIKPQFKQTKSNRKKKQ